MNIKNKEFSKLITFQIFESLFELKEMHEFTFSIRNFIKYLKGTLSKKFVKLMVHKDKHFGILELLESKSIEFLIQISIIEGYIEKLQLGYDNNATVLTLTEKGIDILFGEIEEIEYDDSMCYEYNIKLFIDLVELRNDIVNQFNLTPIRVCSNKILQTISTYTPTTIELLREIDGVGDYFIDNFSGYFLNKIHDYKNHQNKKAM